MNTAILWGHYPANVLFDAHMLIDNDRSVIEIPCEIFKRLSPSRLIFITENPSVILQRRLSDVSRNRPIRSVKEIGKQQDASRQLAEQCAARLAIPYTLLEAGNIRTLLEAIEHNTQ